jgi:hypothetical protein
MISFESDEENSNKLLGRTGHYNPDDSSIGIYVDGRHPKDVLRSLSHELVHHAQNCNGDFESTEELGPGYAQDNEAMRNAELDAYKRGNIIFRDFEDLIKKGDIAIEIDFESAGEPKMSLKEWKSDELNGLLMEKWGFKVQKEEKEIFAPNHYCAHHVRENISGLEGHCIDHNWNERLQEVTEYDVDFGNNDIRTLRVDELTILKASLAEEHSHPVARHEDESEGCPPVSLAGRIDRTDVANKVPPEWIKEQQRTPGTEPPASRGVDEGVGDWIQQKLGGWKAGKQTGTMPKNPKGPDNPKELEATTGTGTDVVSTVQDANRKVQSRADKAAAIGDADPTGRVEDADVDWSTTGPGSAVPSDEDRGEAGDDPPDMYPDYPLASSRGVRQTPHPNPTRGGVRTNPDWHLEQLEELTRWHDLAGLDEQAPAPPPPHEGEDVAPSTTTPTPPTPPTAEPPPPTVEPPPPAAAPVLPPAPASAIVARRDDGNPRPRPGRRNQQENITLDEARDVARRIFEKLSESDKLSEGWLDIFGLGDPTGGYDARRAYRKGAGGKVVRGGSQGRRAKDYAAMGLDPSEAPYDVETALWDAERAEQKAAVADAAGGGRVVRGGSQSDAAKAAERQGIDISMEPESAGLRQYWDAEEEKAREAALPRITPELDPGRPAGSIDVRMPGGGRRVIPEDLVNKILKKLIKEIK